MRPTADTTEMFGSTAFVINAVTARLMGECSIASRKCAQLLVQFQSLLKEFDPTDKSHNKTSFIIWQLPHVLYTNSWCHM